MSYRIEIYDLQSNIKDDRNTEKMKKPCYDSDDDVSLEDISINNVCDSTNLDVCEADLEGLLSRRVSFCQVVEVREHAITIGDHPCCWDGLPLTLDWRHSEANYLLDLECSQERIAKYALPRRLSYEQRRQRLFTVNDFSQQDVKNEEISMVIHMLQNSWSQHAILPAPEMAEIEEEETLPAPPVIQWSRNSRSLRRSTSFIE
jgi:hypothetical protein